MRAGSLERGEIEYQPVRGGHHTKPDVCVHRHQSDQAAAALAPSRHQDYRHQDGDDERAFDEYTNGRRHGGLSLSDCRQPVAMCGEGGQEMAVRPHDADLLERREALLEILQQRFLECFSPQRRSARPDGGLRRAGPAARAPMVATETMVTRGAANVSTAMRPMTVSASVTMLTAAPRPDENAASTECPTA